MTGKSQGKLRVPAQDLAQFTAFSLNVAAAQTWAEGLPIANPALASTQIQQAIENLNRVKVAPDIRFGILQALCPTIEAVLSGVARFYLKQPLAMSDEARAKSELARELCIQCCTAYTIVAVEAVTLQDRGRVRSDVTASAAGALYRAVRFAGSNVLLSYQLCRAAELGCWLEIYQLYALSEQHHLTDTPLPDSSPPGSTVKQALLQIVLMALCQPNKLSQTDLIKIYSFLAANTKRVTIANLDSGNCLFQLDMDSDYGPIYSAIFGGASAASSRFIDTSSLVTQLSQNLEGPDDAGDSKALGAQLTEHLSKALGSMPKRNFKRSKSSEQLHIALGLSNSHYFMAGEKSFAQVLRGSRATETISQSDNLFISKHKRRDVWESANPHEELDEQRYGHEDSASAIEVDDSSFARLERIDAGRSEQHLSYRANIVDSSPGGYCLNWSEELPSTIKTGELACVREQEGGNWIIAVTRWVSKLDRDSTLVGLELLSPTATPYGAKVMQTSNAQAEQFSRVLLLPEIKLVGQPHTLITPRAGFKEKQKIHLERSGEQLNIQLTRQVAATSSFSQFHFRHINLLKDLISEGGNSPVMAAYNSIWTKI